MWLRHTIVRLDVLILFVLAFFCLKHSHACANSFRFETDFFVQEKDLKRIKENIPRNDDAKEASHILVKEYATKYQTDKSLETSNDYGFLLLMTGNYATAVKVFSDIEKRGIGNGMTAANLGTAYELIGNNKQALHWIKQAIKRDANEHEGTEWLHVKILEAKVQIEKQPNWLNTNTVMGIPTQTLIKTYQEGKPPSKRGIVVTDFLGKKQTYSDIDKALRYQIKERRFFVKPPNAVMADLMHSQHLLSYKGQARIGINIFKAYLPKKHGMTKRMQPLLMIAKQEELALKKKQAEARAKQSLWSRLFD